MLFPAERLIEGRGEPMCVKRDTLVREALSQMIANDFSQLPIIDQNGNLVGVISEQSLTRWYYHSEGTTSLLDLPVNHCQAPPVTISKGSDLVEVLDLLEDNYAVIVTEGNKPVGIITNYDTTQFFREISEGLIYVEDIEVSLRQYIEAAFYDKHKMETALFKAFGPDRRDGTKPAKAYHELDFGDHVQLIVSDRNWVKFVRAFEPKELFSQLMDQVREIRNQLMHFRGRLDAVQRDALKTAAHWLETRPKLAGAQVVELRTVELSAEALPARVAERPAQYAEAEPDRQFEGKYKPLHDWLLDIGETESAGVRVTFHDVEKLIVGSLPPSAYEHRSWWANDSTSHRQSQAWLQAGWRVEDVDMSAEQVTFRQADDLQRGRE